MTLTLSRANLSASRKQVFFSVFRCWGTIGCDR